MACGYDQAPINDGWQGKLLYEGVPTRREGAVSAGVTMSNPQPTFRGSREFQAAMLISLRSLCLLAICLACILSCESRSFNPQNSRAPRTSADSYTPAAILASPGHLEMLDLLQDILDQTPHEHFWLGDGRMPRLRKKVARLPARFPAVAEWQLRQRLGKEELRLGREREGITHLTKAYDMLPQLKGQLQVRLSNQLVFQLGVAYMRLGETENCCLRHSPESCILPIRGGGIHTKRNGSKQAIKYFTEVLSNTPEESEMHLCCRWLLNIAYMTLGGYPDDLPEKYLIPPTAFESDEPFPQFVNIAHRLGVDTMSLCGGAIADDFDNDGDLDLVVSTWDTAGNIRLFRNDQNGAFSNRTAQAGLEGMYGGLNLVQADYDNDGDLDILVLRGAWLGENGRHPNSLLRNNGDLTFIDVTMEAGLGKVHYPTQTSSWADYDNDGDLDLYVGNESMGGLSAPCQLFRNNADGTFTDVAKQAGVTNDRFTKAVVWGDYDHDRLPDLYVSNLLGPNRLYHNHGDETFTDVAPELNVTGPIKSFPAWFWDFDNDGNLDLYVAAYPTNIAHLAAASLGLPFDTELAHLYRGNGSGGFESVGSQRGLTRPSAPMGSNFGDLDNDGFLDFYLGTGNTQYEDLMPNVMYRNRGGKDFTDVTTAGGFGHLQKGHAVVFADLDHDGDQDIFEQMGGAVPGDGFRDVLYENPGMGNHWITLSLVGVESNRAAIGARIHLRVIEDGKCRSIYKHVNSGGSFGANPLRQTIGLGRATKIESVEVFWPTTGLTQTFRDMPLDQHLQIVEAQAQYKFLLLPRYKLGAPKSDG